MVSVFNLLTQINKMSHRIVNRDADTTFLKKKTKPVYRTKTALHIKVGKLKQIM